MINKQVLLEHYNYSQSICDILDPRLPKPSSGFVAEKSNVQICSVHSRMPQKRPTQECL